MKETFLEDSIGKIGLSDSEIRLAVIVELGKHMSPINSLDNFIKVADKISNFVLFGIEDKKSEVTID